MSLGLMCLVLAGAALHAAWAGQPLPLYDELHTLIVSETIPGFVLGRQGYLDGITANKDAFAAIITSDQKLMPKYAELVYYGFWFAPEREALQALIDEGQKFVTGTVRLKLYKGNIITCGRKSPYSLYDFKIASMEGVKSWYNQSDATGFIRLNGLRLRARNLAQGGPKI